MFLKTQPIDDALREYVKDLNRQLVIRTQLLYENASRSVAMDQYLRMLLTYLADRKTIANLSVNDKLNPIVLIHSDTPLDTLTGEVVRQAETLMVLSVFCSGRLHANFYENHDYKCQIEILAVE